MEVLTRQVVVLAENLSKQLKKIKSRFTLNKSCLEENFKFMTSKSSLLFLYVECIFYTFKSIKMQKKILIIVSSLFIFSTCSVSSNETKEEKKVRILKPTKVLSQLGDSIFFKKVKVCTYKSTIIFMDETNARIIVTDQKHNILYAIHKRGDAPHELRYPLNILVRNDTLFVEDSNFKINAYHFKNGVYLCSFKTEAKSAMGNTWATDTFGYFYLSSEPDEYGKSILQLNTQGKPIKWFGEKYPDEVNNYNAHYKIIQITEKQDILALSRTWGYIDFYNTNEGKLIKRIALNQYEPVRRALDSMENDKRRNPEIINHIRNLFTSVLYLKGKIYVTFTDRIGTNRKLTRHILVFSVDENKYEIRFSEVLKIETQTHDDDIDFELLNIDEENKLLYLQGKVTYNIYIIPLE